MHYLIFILIIPIIAAVMLRIWTHRLTWQFFSRPTHLPSAGCEPVSILVPVRGLDQQAEANYRSYCEQEYGATHEVIFALEEEDDPAAAVIEALAASYPPESVRLIISRDAEGIGKIRNQIAAARQCRHDLWILVDSDVRLPPDFLHTQAIRLLSEKGVGLAYAAPCPTGSEDWVAALHNLSVCNSILTYGSAAMRGNLNAAVGSCILTRRDVIAAIGGLERLANRVVGLDVALGRAVVEAGYKIELLPQPARIHHARDRFMRFWWQSHRWLATINLAVPGIWIAILMLGLPLWWALAFVGLAVANSNHQVIGLSLVILVLLMDVVSAAVINLRLARDAKLWKFLWVALLQQLFLLPNLVLAVTMKKVQWRGRWLSLNASA
ncbi:MAG: glycosyltransferase [Thiohalocapsa sp. PB-PSB1]|jgi:ceramide glucosyltransferase|nr:MAG: glycosyltransferase [Thiohalocapsa sp. PB-PSB1]